MKIVITGGAGYIGSAMVKFLENQESIKEIIVYDNLSSGNMGLFTSSLNSKVKFIEGDILDSRKFKKTISNADALLHTVSMNSTTGSLAEMHQLEQVNHWGSAEVAYAVEATPSIKNVVMLSSTDVYGPGKFEATDKVNPTSPYAISMFRGEEQLARLKQTCILRLGEVVGISPATDFNLFLNKIILKSKISKRINVYGTGYQIASYVGIETVTKAIYKSIAENITGVYNLASSRISTVDLLDILKDINPELEFIFINHHLELPSSEVFTSPAFMSDSNIDLKEVLNSMYSKLG